MSNESNVNYSEDKFSKLISAWTNVDKLPFDQWLINLSNAFASAGMTLKIGAVVLDVRPAELQAALNLASLDEESLILLAGQNPPPTTWFSLASASTGAIKAALLALSTPEAKNSPSSVVEAAIRNISGPSVAEKVGSLPSEVFGHAAKKAEAFQLLTEKSRNALKGFQRTKRTSGSLSPAQVAFAKDLLQQLVDGGAISRDSKDGDTEICNLILDALDEE
jgi:hypothetical protein